MGRRVVLAFVLGLLIMGVPFAAQSYTLSRQLSGSESQLSLLNQEIANLWEGINALKEGSGKNDVTNSTNDMMNFTFTWGPEAQDIVDGTFKMQVSVWFENHISPWDNAMREMFYIVVRVYDDDYCPGDYLGLVFDMNHNGVIDLGHKDDPLIIYANNSTVYIGAAFLCREGFFAVAEVPRIPAYKCRYDPEKGYAFGPFGYQASDITSKFGDMPTYIPIHMCFVDANLYPGIHGVSVQFRIYLDS